MYCSVTSLETEPSLFSFNYIPSHHPDFLGAYLLRMYFFYFCMYIGWVTPFSVSIDQFLACHRLRCSIFILVLRVSYIAGIDSTCIYVFSSIVYFFEGLLDEVIVSRLVSVMASHSMPFRTPHMGDTAFTKNRLWHFFSHLRSITSLHDLLFIQQASKNNSIPSRYPHIAAHST